MKIGINGFGRVGRCLFRVNYWDKKYEIVAIKDIMPIENIAYLLKYDSTYGTFKGEIKIKGNKLVVEGKGISYFQEKDVTKIKWDVDILIESSGSVPVNVAKKIPNLKNVIYTQNMNGVDKTIIYGVNEQEYNHKKHKIISSSTCTGNAITIITKIIRDNFGIESGHLVTIHPVLSDQRQLDVSHKIFNLGRNANSSIIPTPTKIVESLCCILPNLKGKFTSISYRVPISIVSVIDATFNLKKKTTLKDINSILKKSKIEYDDGYLGYSKVSIDFFKNPNPVIVQGLSIKLSNNLLSLTLFHDNEWGYCNQVHKLIEYIIKENV